MATEYKAPAVEKLFDILELMVENNCTYSLIELSKRLKISTNSVFRIIKEMEHRNYVVRTLEGTYELTPKIYYLGSKISDRIDVVNLSKGILKELSATTKETVLIAVLDEKYNTLVLNQVISPLSVKFISTPGMSYPTHCSAMGKAILAYDKSGIADKLELTKMTGSTITDYEEFIRELENVQRVGFASDMEESFEGLRCIGAPVFSFNNNVVCAIGISGPSFRMTRENMKSHSFEITKKALELSKLFGYKEGDMNETD